MLFATPELSRKDLEVVARIGDIKKHLGVAIRAPKRWSGILARTTLAKAIQGSNSIEGYSVSMDDAIAAVEGEEPLDAKTEEWLAVTSYRRAMTYVLQLSADQHFAYSNAVLRSLHFMMLEYDLSKHPGSWRPGPIFVRREATGEIVYEGPEIESVPALMDELIESLTSDSKSLPDLVAAAMAHLNLVMIHPFSDGNGRMARCLQTLVLGRLGILAPEFSSIEEYLGRSRTEYYAVLAEVGGPKWMPERNAHPWIKFCLTAHFLQASRVLRRSRILDQLWGVFEEETTKQGLPDRCVLALLDAFLTKRIRNSTYRKSADISDQVAGKDLRELVRVGLLVPEGEKRGRFYVASDSARRAAERVKIPKILEDPYADAEPYLPGITPEAEGL